MSNTRRDTRSALRAALQREDASVAGRLPATGMPVAAPASAAAGEGGAAAGGAHAPAAGRVVPLAGPPASAGVPVAVQLPQDAAPAVRAAGRKAAAVELAKSMRKRKKERKKQAAVLAARALERRTGGAGAALVAQAALAAEAVHEQRAQKKEMAHAAAGGNGPERRKGKKMDKAEKSHKAERREKVVRDSFSLPKSEQAQLKALRADLARAGRTATKSEVLRAALHLLSQRSTEELGALLDALPVVPKGKARK